MHELEFRQTLRNGSNCQKSDKNNEKLSKKRDLTFNSDYIVRKVNKLLILKTLKDSMKRLPFLMYLLPNYRKLAKQTILF